MSEWIENTGEMPVEGSVLIDTLWDDASTEYGDNASGWGWRLDGGITHWRLSEAIDKASDTTNEFSMNKLDTTNPKALLGLTNLPMTMLSPLTIALGNLGKLNGKLKYGGANYIGTEVVMSIYMDAILRHFYAILCGEDADPIDNVPHWGAILANIDIIVNAQAAGSLIDDRLRSDGQLEAMRELKPLVASLQELHKEKNPKHYYMKDADGTK